MERCGCWERALVGAGFARFGAESRLGSSVGATLDSGLRTCVDSRLGFSLWYRGEIARAWLERHFDRNEKSSRDGRNGGDSGSLAGSMPSTQSQDVAQGFSPIILAQSDTTAGFLSRDKRALNRIKGREEEQEILRTFASFYELAKFSRIPRAHRSFVRRASRTSFILSPQKAFRIVKDPHHAEFLRHVGWLYSTSANAHGQRFSLEFALRCADIVVLDSRGIYESKPSRILKLSCNTKVPLRA